MHGAPCRGARGLGRWRPQLGGHALQQLPKCMRHMGRSLYTQHVPEGNAQHKQKGNTQTQDRQGGWINKPAPLQDTIAREGCIEQKARPNTHTHTHKDNRQHQGSHETIAKFDKGLGPNLRPPMRQHEAIEMFDKGWAP